MLEQSRSSQGSGVRACEVFLWVRGIRVSKAFYERVQTLSKRRMNRLFKLQRPVNPATLCGTLWHEFSDGEKNLATICIEHMVDKDILPLTRASSQ